MENHHLMYDSSEKDGKAEIVMDYVLSWCLRCAEDGWCQDKPKLQNKCKFLLSKLLNLTLNNVSIKSVNVWKERNEIDLWVEVQLIKDDTSQEKHAILIENKYYSGLHLSKDFDGEYRNQLLVYKRKFDEYYANLKESFHLHYNVISCISRIDPKFSKLFDYVGKNEYEDFNVFYLYELVQDDEPAESDIYNEFMLGGWY